MRRMDLILPLACVLMITAPLFAQRSEKPTLDVTGYVIDAEIDTATHHLAATAAVSFTAPADAESVTFGLHPALKISKISDDSGALLTGERLPDGSVRIAPASPFVQGQAAHWSFAYEGTITGNDDGPIEGLKLAAIQEPISFLLYPARWFPMTGYMTDRFTMELHIRVPQGMRVFASGSTGRIEAGDPGKRQAGRPVRLQLEQAGIPRHGDRRTLR